MDAVVHRILRFDRFALDLARGCLRSGERDVGLRPKAFKLLHHLVKNAGRLVAKEELHKEVWGAVVVSDDSLVQCIRQLRQILGDDEHRLIKTVSRRGYLLDVEVFDGGAVGTGAELAAHTANTLPPASGEVLTHPPQAIADDGFTGERKFVTVLYAHIKESLEFCAERDPEEALTVFEAVLKLMTQAVRRYDGTISLVTTGGIVALFGAPLAHEDHAIRACNAAVQIRQAVERYSDGPRSSAAVPIRVRAGLASGEVVIRPIDNGRQPEPRAMGPTMHAASRIGQRAAPGQLLISQETRRLTEGHVEVKALARAAGRAADEVFELVGAGPARTRFQARVARGLTRFVGRDAELEQLRRASELARRGHGQVVALVAEPGVGKSRLVHEFSRSRHLHGWLVLEGAAVSYGKATSYLPVVTLLQAYFEIRDRDDPREIGEKVKGKLLGLDPALETTLPALLALLDVPYDPSAGPGPAAAWEALAPPERRQRMHDAVKRLLLREARRQPLLVIFEDLHWIDGETQALLDGLVESLGMACLLLLATYRLEYQHAWSGKKSYSQIRLDALSVETTGELLDGLLGKAPALTPLKRLLDKRGNPFFLEETVRTLVETRGLAGQPGRYRLTQPIQAIHIPATVQVILAARIDRLAPADKRLLQTASVIGKDVPVALLQAVGELPNDAVRAGLDRLRSAELLCEKELFSDPEFSFRHALTHEVTYGGLLHEHRREIHGRIVQAIETLYRDRPDAHIERLAHHAVRGGLKEKAVDYLRQAGLKAAARSALPDARHWFEQALGVLETLPESPSTLAQAFEIRLDLRPVLNLLGELPQAIERLREAEGLAERLDDDARRGRVCAWVTNHHAFLGDLDQALVSGSRALEIAERLGDLRLRVLTTTLLEEPHYFRGEFERVIELATRNLAALPADPVDEDFSAAAIPVAALPISANDRYWLVRSLAELGRFGEAARHAAELLRSAGRTSHAYTVGVAHRAAGALHLLKGEWAQARSLCERGVAAYRTGNVGARLPSAVAASAWILAQIGETSGAADRLREGEELLERQAGRGQIHDHGWAYHALGHSALLLGRIDAARRLADSGAKFSARNPGSLAHVHHLCGDLATHPDRFDAELGETHYRAALALAEQRGMRPLMAHCHLGLGKLKQRTGDRQQAHEHLTTAATMYGEMDMRFWLEQATAAKQPAIKVSRA